MSVLDHLERLKAIQEIDREILALGETLEALPRALADEEQRVRLLGEEHAAAVENVRTLRINVAALELDLRSKEDETAKLNVQLNQVKTNKEYTALMGAIQIHKTDIGKLEDILLAAMNEVEVADAAAKVVAGRVAAGQESLARKRGEIEAARRDAEARCAARKADRQNLAKDVDPAGLQQYERIFRGLRDAVVVPVEDGACQGCRISLRPQIISVLMGGKTLVTCPNCQRILHL
ncbi:MAG: C4-type zinc ribbon domain-containing protein [Planctomycetota bacterium]